MLQETIDDVTTELKRFAQKLSLSEPQKEQLRTYLAAKHAELEKYREQHPNLSRGELVQKIGAVRGSLREQVVKFLTPEQLQKWDAEVSKAKEFWATNYRERDKWPDHSSALSGSPLSSITFLC